MAGWKITIFDRRYIFNPGPLSRAAEYLSLPECIYIYNIYIYIEINNGGAVVVLLCNLRAFPGNLYGW